MIEVRIGGEVKMCRHNANEACLEGMEVGVWALVEIGEFASEPEVVSAVLILAFLKAVRPISVSLFAKLNAFDFGKRQLWNIYIEADSRLEPFFKKLAKQDIDIMLTCAEIGIWCVIG